MAPRIQSERGQSQGDTLAGVNQKAAASVDSAEQNTTAAPTIQPAPATPAPTDTAKVTHPLSIAHAGAQVAHEIVRRFDGDTTTFDLRLDPPELGRVEVRLEVSRDNKVTAVVTADNPQTLAEMARNARDLQSALQGAGLDLADNGLSFDLRQGGRENGDRQGAGTPANQSSLSTDAADAPIARIVSLDPWRGSAIDLMA
jgi:flagellar hook-length control protein FliK